jgi:hypothetical protein
VVVLRTNTDLNPLAAELRYNALALKAAELGHALPRSVRKALWPAVIGDLDALTGTEVEQDGRPFLLRSAPKPAGLALRFRRRTGNRRSMIAVTERVVPSRRPRLEFGVDSITWQMAL